MTEKTVIKKVSGGKLFRIDVSYNRKRIEDIKITGDFFLHPEDAILEIEKFIIDSPKKLEEDVFERKVSGILDLKEAQLIGVSSRDVAQAIKEVVR